MNPLNEPACVILTLLDICQFRLVCENPEFRKPCYLTFGAECDGVAAAQEKTNHLVVVEVARQHQRRHMHHKLGALQTTPLQRAHRSQAASFCRTKKGICRVKISGTFGSFATKTTCYRSQTKSGQGNVFTPICESVHRGVYPSMQWGRHLSRQTPPSDRHLCWADTTSLPRQTPSYPRIIRDTVNKRAVRILTVKGSFKLSKSERERELFSLILVIGFYV